MIDWIQLLTPLIVVATPLVIAMLKKGLKSHPALAGLEDRLTPFWPVIAPILGVGLDQFMGLMTSHQADVRYGVLYGLAGVAVREIVNNYKKARPSNGGGPTAMKTLLVTGSLLLVTGGCARYVTPDYVKCSGKGNFTYSGGMGGGMIYGGGGLINSVVAWDCGQDSTFSVGKDTTPDAKPAK